MDHQQAVEAIKQQYSETLKALSAEDIHLLWQDLHQAGLSSWHAWLTQALSDAAWRQPSISPPDPDRFLFRRKVLARLTCLQGAYAVMTAQAMPALLDCKDPERVPDIAGALYWSGFLRGVKDWPFEGQSPFGEG